MYFNAKNRGEFFKQASFADKQKMVGSIFPENLIFEEKTYRTTRINEALQLIFSINKDFREESNKKATKNSGLSTWAPPVGLEPTTL